MTVASLIHGLVWLSIPWLVLEVAAQYAEPIAGGKAGSASLTAARDKGDSDRIQRVPPWLAALALRINRMSADSSKRSTTRLTGDRRGDENRSTRGGTTVSRTRFTIRLETTALNGLPAKVLRIAGIHARPRSASRASNGSNGELHEKDTGDKAEQEKPLLLRFYQLGAWIGLMACIVSLYALVFGAMALLANAFGGSATEAASQSVIDANPLLPRALSEDDDALQTRALPDGTQAPHPFQLKPLIPGLTLPWNHLVPLTIALATVQIIHEAGHAFCAALHGIPPLSIGVMLIYPIIPAAFVVLPPSALTYDEDEEMRETYDQAEQGSLPEGRHSSGSDSRDKSFAQRLQIITSGVCHNLLTAGIMAFVALIGLTSLAHATFFDDAGGLRVVGVDPASQFSAHVRPGMMVTHIDDADLVAIGRRQDRLDKWTRHLNSLRRDKAPEEALGWCVPTHNWDSLPPDCCTRLDMDMPRVPGDAQLCFKEVPYGTGRCSESHFIVEDKYQRCTDSCIPGQSCIHADPRESLIRLNVRDGMAPRIILFQGEGAAVLQALTLSAEDFSYQDRDRLRGFYETGALVWQYTLTLSVAMALFNMLFLPGLDGDALLSLLVSAIVAEQRRIKSDDAKENTAKKARLMRMLISTSSRILSASMLASLQRRLHMLTTALAVFVFGGSLLMHASAG